MRSDQMHAQSDNPMNCVISLHFIFSLCLRGMYFQLCHMCGSQQLNHAWCFDNSGHIQCFLCDLVLWWCFCTVWDKHRLDEGRQIHRSLDIWLFLAQWIHCHTAFSQHLDCIQLSTPDWKSLCQCEPRISPWMNGMASEIPVCGV